ncbi:hypothetical protein [Pseudomonas sp. CAM1A]|uniref:hypothetical protein n=1 Tax=Pseudomonas sp. CAM1A TaxID=3231717 RepID=UPI0039C6B993
MIDLSGWPASMKLILISLPFLLIITGGLINTYIAGSSHFDVMCRAFRRSSGLRDEIMIWGTLSQKSRMVIVSAMTLGLIWPSLGYRQGWLSIEDTKDFPGYLSRLMKISSCCLLSGFAILFLLICFTKLTRS